MLQIALADGEVPPNHQQPFRVLHKRTTASLTACGDILVLARADDTPQLRGPYLKVLAHPLQGNADIWPVWGPPTSLAGQCNVTSALEWFAARHREVAICSLGVCRRRRGRGLLKVAGVKAMGASSGVPCAQPTRPCCRVIGCAWVTSIVRWTQAGSHSPVMLAIRG